MWPSPNRATAAWFHRLIVPVASAKITASAICSRIASASEDVSSTSSPLLLCEFARKKKNPSLKRSITPPCALLVVYRSQHADVPPMIASFSAEPPVIRGRNRSHASSRLFVRDQETSALHTFDRAGGVAGTRRETKSQLARCSYLNENASIHGEPFRNPSILSLPGVMALWSRFL